MTFQIAEKIKKLEGAPQDYFILPAKEYFSHVKIPESWDSLGKFIEWYIKLKMPLAIPWDSIVSVTDSSTSMVIFRRMPYMVELFFLYPGKNLPAHSTPGVETQIMILGGGCNYDQDAKSNFDVCDQWGAVKPLLDGNTFCAVGECNSTNMGLALLIFSKWPNPNPKDILDIKTTQLIPMTSTAIHWHGQACGSEHLKLVTMYRKSTTIENDSIIYSTEIDTCTVCTDVVSLQNVAKLDPVKFYSHLSVPEDWNTLEEFAEWYINSKMPLAVPWNSHVIVSDDACAATVFRKGRYQVELYFIHPHYNIVEHCHPGMEVITLFLGGGKMNAIGARSFHNTADAWGQIRRKLKSGEYHGGGMRNLEQSLDGFLLYAIQKWPEDTEITSAAINWKGQTAGPKQEKLIQMYRPDAIVTSGYAEV